MLVSDITFEIAAVTVEAVMGAVVEAVVIEIITAGVLAVEEVLMGTVSTVRADFVSCKTALNCLG